MTRAFLLPTRLDEIFEDGILGRYLDNSSACSKGACFGVNLYENEDSIIAEAPVPGIKHEDIKVFFDKGGLSIEAKAVEEKKDVKYHLKSSQSYSYWVPLPAGRVDESKTPEANCKDGILKITFQKSRASKPLKIEIRHG